MGQQLDVVLINPGDQRRIYQSLETELVAVEPPVWTGLLASYARQQGFSVQVIDASAENLSHREVAERVKELNPLLAALVTYGHQPSATTQTMTAAGATCSALRDVVPEIKRIMIGGHVASLPERTLREEDVDYVCTGEGPVTLKGLVMALRSNRNPQLDLVPGLMYMDSDHPRSTFPAPLVRDLDNEMPGMAWDLLPMDKYRAHNWHCFGGEVQRQPYASMYTTFGCPYRCTFCCIQAPFKEGESVLGYKSEVNSYRFWSPDQIISQIDTLVTKYGVRNIKIADEMFVLNVKHVHGICDRIIERGYDLNIWAYARVDTIRHPETLDKLRRAGVNWLAFGIESANARVRDDVAKGYGQDLILDTIARVQAAGINIIANYIFGLPEDDHATMQETLDMALDINAEFANFYSTMAYPGSALYTQAIKDGWPLPDTWAGFSQHAYDTLPLPTKYISSGEVLAFRDQAFDTYFTHPRYLSMIEQKFGAKTLEHIKQMTSHKLERKYASVPKAAVAAGH